MPENAEEPHGGDPSTARTLNPDAIRGGRPDSDDLAARKAKAAIAGALFSSASAEEEAPETLGRYRLERELGAGGMGVVYEAFDPELERRVAVKVLHPQTAEDEVARARMVREARSMARVSHPNVIAVYDVGDEDGQVFVAMELVVGETLTRWLRDEARSPDAVLERFVAAGEGLWAAHQCELVHRDFKPDNVLVGSDGRVRVLDFGLARNLQTPEIEVSGDSSALRLAQEKAVVTAITQAGSLVGTPRYMAPEQFQGTVADAKSDQYSFGVALFEGLYGEPPFSGKSIGELIQNIAAGERTARASNRPVPPGVIKVVDRAMARDPGDRYRDMGALLEALRAVVEPKRESKRRALWGIGALAAVACVALLVAISMGNRSGTSGEEGSRNGDVATVAAVDESGEAAPSGEAGETTGGPGDVVSVREDVPAITTSPPSEDAGEPQGETGAESVVPEVPKRITDWCYMHEDGYKLLHRGEKKRSKLRNKGVCYRCRRERSKSRIARFSPSDCGGYLVCGPEECG